MANNLIDGTIGKVFEHPDHQCSEVTTRQMTAEEKQRYGEPNTEAKKPVRSYFNSEESIKARGKFEMNKLNIPLEDVQNICAEHGTGAKAARIIAEKYNISPKQAENQITHKIKGKAKKEAQEFAESIDMGFTYKAKVNENVPLLQKSDSQPVKHMLKFYIASKLENAEMVKNLSNVLKAFLWKHTYDWTVHGSVQNQGEARITEVAENEINGVKEADVIIVLLPGGRGTHAELGAANALNKKVFIWAENDELFMHDERTCAFYWNHNVTRISGDRFNLLAQLIQYTSSNELIRELI